MIHLVTQESSRRDERSKGHNTAEIVKKEDNPAFNKESITSLIKAAETETPNFGTIFAMYLGEPSLAVVKIKEAFKGEKLKDEQLAEMCFRDWYNGRKRVGKPLERYKEIYNALIYLEKPLFAEIFQQRYMDESAMRYDDFLLVLKESKGKASDASWI